MSVLCPTLRGSATEQFGAEPQILSLSYFPNEVMKNAGADDTLQGGLREGENWGIDGGWWVLGKA